MKNLRQGGFAVAGTLLVAAASSLVLVAGCHSTPTQSGVAAAAPARVAAATSEPAPDIATEHPFDEHFYVPPAEDATPQN